jgi:hypothetical protein
MAADAWATVWRALAACALLLAASAHPTPATQQQEVGMSDRDPLAQLIEPINADVARMVRDPATTVERLDTPFLLQGLIFRVDWRGPYKPVTLTIGYARRDNFTVLLPLNHEGFQELVARAGVALDTDENRVALAVTELETTRRFDETFVVLRSFRDLRLMTNPTPADEQRFRALKQQYGPLIELPRTGGNGPWTLPIYVLSRDELCLFTVMLDAAGSSTIAKTVLEADTPLLPAAS